MPSPERPLSLRHAVALGLLQGPTELLPVSSSAHTMLLPWLVGWPRGELDGELRKAFEVALHIGAGLALAIDMRGDPASHPRPARSGRVRLLALSLLPPSLAGFALRRAIERRLGGPQSVAAGLAAGALAMALADRNPGGRGREQATSGDALALGIAQACALVPGVSRNGATLAAARARGFDRTAAQSLSWEVALPVMLAAGTLKGAGMVRRGLDTHARALLAAGALSAFLSTLASARLLRRRGRALAPYALYRCLLAALVAARLRGGRRAG